MHPPHSARGRVCAVFVTYHPDEGFSARLAAVLPQVAAVVIVDNGSSPDEVDMLRSVATAPTVLIGNAENRGIAHALNTGMRHAQSLDTRWALLLDQDTQVDPDLVDGLFAALATAPDDRPTAIIGAAYRDTHGQKIAPLPLAASSALWQEVESVVTSGSLLSLPAYEAIGPFRDEFFIDHVDTEYCLRARGAGFCVLQTRRPMMAHTVGAPRAHRLLGMTKWTTNHPAERRYYIARNDTVMLKERSKAQGRAWRLKSFGRCFRLCKRIVLYEEDKLAKTGAVIQGWWHGIHGIMGPRKHSHNN